MAKREVLYKDRKFAIAYDIEGEGTPCVVLHGWGSNKEIMKQAFRQCKGCKRLYIDLPGFGRSSNEMVLTTHDYANIVEKFLQAIDFPKEIIVGHSFGGKVAVLLEPKLLVLLSSAGIPTTKPLQVRAKIALYKMLKPFGITKLRNFFVADDAKGMSENMYETFKNVVDEDFREIFAKFRGKSLLFWGAKDTATPLASGKEMAKVLQSKLTVLPGDHYFFLHQGKTICEAIREEYEKL